MDMFAAGRCRLGSRVFLRSLDNGSSLISDSVDPRYRIKHIHERLPLCERLNSTCPLLRTCSKPSSQTASPGSRLCHVKRHAHHIDDIDWAREFDRRSAIVEPVTVALPYSRRTVLVKRLNERQLDEINDVIILANDAVNRRDNMGVNEFPPTDELKEALQKHRTALFTVHDTVINSTTNQLSLLAAILIQPCRAARSIRPRLASVQIISTEEISRDLYAARDLTRIAVKMVSSVREGFVACVTFVYYECFRHLAAWIDEGFVVTACLPLVGVLKSPSAVSGTLSSESSHVAGEGCTAESTAPASSSYLLYRKLEGCSTGDNTNVDPAGDSEIKAYADSLCSVSGESSPYFDEKSLWSSRSPPKLDHIPAVVTLPKSGFRVKLRCIDESELDKYYATFLGAAKSDRGFRVEEIPTRRFFVWLYSQYWNFVAEDATTGDWVAVVSMAPSTFSRTRSPCFISDGALIITPGYRNLRRGLPADLLQLWSSLTVDLGFRACLSDTAMDNIEAVRISIDAGLIAVGSLPSAMLSRGPGKSTDIVLLYRPLAAVESFKNRFCT